MSLSLIRYKPAIQYSLLFFILVISSLYLGLLISLHLIWYPGWSTITIDALDLNFSRPAKEAVRIFKPLVIVIDLASIVLIFFAMGKKRRFLSVCLFFLLALFTFISARYVIPLNNELANLTDERFLKEKLLLWMRYNDYRMVIIMLVWLLALALLIDLNGKKVMIYTKSQ